MGVAYVDVGILKSLTNADAHPWEKAYLLINNRRVAHTEHPVLCGVPTKSYGWEIGYVGII